MKNNKQLERIKESRWIQTGIFIVVLILLLGWIRPDLMFNISGGRFGTQPSITTKYDLPSNYIVCPPCDDPNALIYVRPGSTSCYCAICNNLQHSLLFEEVGKGDICCTPDKCDQPTTTVPPTTSTTIPFEECHIVTSIMHPDKCVGGCADSRFECVMIGDWCECIIPCEEITWNMINNEGLKCEYYGYCVNEPNKACLQNTVPGATPACGCIGS